MFTFKKSFRKNPKQSMKKIVKDAIIELIKIDKKNCSDVRRWYKVKDHDIMSSDVIERKRE